MIYGLILKMSQILNLCRCQGQKFLPFQNLLDLKSLTYVGMLSELYSQETC